MNAYVLGLLTLNSIMIIFALSLNVITGYCGQVSLGHAAFYGIGAYTSAMMAVAGVPFLATIPAAMVLSAIFGYFVGLTSLRVRHDFLAITTMACGFLFLGVVRKSTFLGGELGISSVPPSGLGSLGDTLLAVGSALVVIILSLYIQKNWTGLAFRAVESDEDAARTVAVNPPSYKLLAFCLGTALAGLAGALYVNYARFIVPDTFSFGTSIAVLAMITIGGIGSTFGVCAGATLLTLFPEVFRFLGNYRLLTYGSLLILVMMFIPKGLAGVPAILYRRSSSP